LWLASGGAHDNLARIHFRAAPPALPRNRTVGMTTQAIQAPAHLPEHEQKRVALGYLHEAWAEARHEGVDGDCLAQACLFAAFAEFVATYGEEAAAKFAEGLALRVRNGEFSLALARQ
jgi:hypothetical protein